MVLSRIGENCEKICVYIYIYIRAIENIDEFFGKRTTRLPICHRFTHAFIILSSFRHIYASLKGMQIEECVYSLQITGR